MPRIVRAFIIAITLSLFFAYSGISLAAIPKVVKPITSFSLTPTLGAYLFANADSLNATPLYGLKLSYDHIGSTITDTIGVEGTVNYFSTTTKSGAHKADGFLFRADAIYSITPRKKWVPFFALGAGGIFIDKGSTRDGSPFINYGVGIKYFLENYLALRVDLRQLFVYNNVSTRNNFEFSTGLTYYFGKERIKKAPPLPPGKEPATPPKTVPDIVDTDNLTAVPPDAATK